MPRPVCVPCGREMMWERVGVVVQLDAKASRGPYQQWRGDTAKCPGCGAEVVARFAERPTWEHFHDDPPEMPDVVVPEGPHQVDPVRPHPFL